MPRVGSSPSWPLRTGSASPFPVPGPAPPRSRTSGDRPRPRATIRPGWRRGKPEGTAAAGPTWFPSGWRRWPGQGSRKGPEAIQAPPRASSPAGRLVRTGHAHPRVPESRWRIARPAEPFPSARLPASWPWLRPHKTAYTRCHEGVSIEPMNILGPEGQSEPPPPSCRAGRQLRLKGLVFGSCLALWAALAWLDLALGLRVRFGPFYAVPVLLATWYLGRAWGLLSALVSGTLWHALQMAVLHQYPVLAFRHWVYWDLSRASSPSWPSPSRHPGPGLFDREQELNRNLQRANDQVKALEGMLPICAWCRKVRDDQGAGRRSRTTSSRTPTHLDPWHLSRLREEIPRSVGTSDLWADPRCSSSPERPTLMPDLVSLPPFRTSGSARRLAPGPSLRGAYPWPRSSARGPRPRTGWPAPPFARPCPRWPSLPSGLLGRSPQADDAREFRATAARDLKDSGAFQLLSPAGRRPDPGLPTPSSGPSRGPISCSGSYPIPWPGGNSSSRANASTWRPEPSS